MKLESVWTRQLHQQVNPKVFIVDNLDLYVIERERYLVNIDIRSGIQKWCVKVPDCWGWLTLFNASIYYLSQNNDLLVIDRIAGEITCHRKINIRLPAGYVLPTRSAFVTGGWRGYSDLACYDLETFQRIWSRATLSSKLTNFSIPYLLTETLLFTIDSARDKIAIVDVSTGSTEFEIVLPDEIDYPDLGRPYQVINGKIVFVTRDGNIFRLSDDFSRLDREDLILDSIVATLPFWSGREVIFENDRGCYCLYDLNERKVRWERNIRHNFQHNFKHQQVYACKLTQNYYAIAGALGQIMVVDRDGVKIGHIKSEKRITTPLQNIDDLLIYTSKSEIKVVRFFETVAEEL